MGRSIRVHSPLHRRRPVGARRAVGTQTGPVVTPAPRQIDLELWGPAVTVGILAAVDAVLLGYGLTVI